MGLSAFQSANLVEHSTYSPMQGTFFLSAVFNFSALFLRYFQNYVSYDPDFLLTYSPESGEYFSYLQHVSKVISRHSRAILSKKFLQKFKKLTFVSEPKLRLDHDFKRPFQLFALFLRYFHFYVSYDSDFFADT